MKRSDTETMRIIQSVCDDFPVYQGLSEVPLKLEFKVLRKADSDCPFCDFPLWKVIFKMPIAWSDGTITYDTMTVHLHSFIEVSDISSFSKDISIHNIQKFITLSALLCAAFNNTEYTSI